MASNRTSRMTVRRYASAAEADRHEIEYWMQLFIGRASFIRNKRATGRPKDLGDIEGME